MSVVKLTVHKNNMMQRKKKQLRAKAVERAKECVKSADIAGFCVIGWDKNGNTKVSWRIEDESPFRLCQVPFLMDQSITRTVAQLDREES